MHHVGRLLPSQICAPRPGRPVGRPFALQLTAGGPLTGTPLEPLIDSQTGARSRLYIEALAKSLGTCQGNSTDGMVAENQKTL